jgi:exportin-1
MFALAARGAASSLAAATLDTLHAYLSWVPLAYVFESDVVSVLLSLFPAPAHRVASLRCLTEVAALTVGAEHDAAFVSLLTVFMAALAPMLPPNGDLAAAHAAGSADDQDFVHALALFLTTLLRAHAPAIEADPAARPALLAALDVLVSASFVADDEVRRGEEGGGGRRARVRGDPRLTPFPPPSPFS